MTENKTAWLGPDAVAAAFPLGGIGTGNVSIGARGELRDWELMNRPDKGRSLPFTFFAIRAAVEGDEPVSRVLESRLVGPHEFDQGYAATRVAGLPRLAGSRMRGEYPLLSIDFEDDDLPVDVSLTAFTPLVPHDLDASSLPVAVLRYRVTNPASVPVDVTIAASLSNPIGVTKDSYVHFPGFDGRPTIDWTDDGTLRGLAFGTDLDPEDERYGTLSLVTTDPSVTAKPQWLVGYWQDGVQSFWNDFCDDGLLEAEEKFSLDSTPGGLFDPAAEPLTDDQLAERLPRLRTGSLGIVHRLRPGEQQEFEFILSWSFPNRPRGWLPRIFAAGTDSIPLMKNYYATRFTDSHATARHLAENLPRLEEQTRAFHGALFDSSLDPAVTDALSANIAALRSTTCFLLDDGRFAAWEGSFDHVGSCEGTCTHVWNYAQTVAHLFPELERSARRTEFLLETDEHGQMQFRTQRLFDLPSWNMLPAVDGQLGTIVRLHREWRLSGDDDFLQELWPAAQRAIDFAGRHWDADGDGVLDSPAHNTYDIEFHGQEPLANGMYLAALAAMAAMAAHLGHAEAASRYREQAESASAQSDALLFNGEYYEQKLADVDAFRYQYGSGVLSDQLFGQLLAHSTGLGHILPKDHVRSAIHAVYRHNFRPDLSRHHSVQRTYALGNEGGLLLASWPRGGRPRIPFVYSDEVWTGIEHQVAAHLIFEGLVDEGLTLVRATRGRHSGRNRNPWNEAECGNHYARSMSSWALLLSLSGVDWNGATRELVIDPAEPGDLTCFFGTGGGWGTLTLDRQSVTLTLLHGTVDIDALTVRGIPVPLPDGGSLCLRAGHNVHLQYSSTTRSS